MLLALHGDSSALKALQEDFKNIKARFDSKVSGLQIQRANLTVSLIYYGLLIFFYTNMKDVNYDFIFELFFDSK